MTSTLLPCTTFKFVDNVTLTETLASIAIEIQSADSQVFNWSDANFMASAASDLTAILCSSGYSRISHGVAHAPAEADYNTWR